MISQAITGYRQNAVRLSIWALVTFGTYYLGIIAGQSATTDTAALVFALGGSVLTTVVAYPWFRTALNTVDEEASPLDATRLVDQAVASTFFWAGVLLGAQYLSGIPALVVLVFYAFFGYAVADNPAKGGLKALGWSVHIGTKRRLGVAAMITVLFLINILAFLPYGFGLGSVAEGATPGPVWIALTVMLLIVTSNISMVGGAVVYRTLERTVPES